MIRRIFHPAVETAACFVAVIVLLPAGFVATRNTWADYVAAAVAIGLGVAAFFQGINAAGRISWRRFEQ